MDRWVTDPPYPCHRTGKQEAKDGPYLVEDWACIKIRVGPDGTVPDGPVRQLVHSASFIERICDAPGSPYVLLSKEQAAAHTQLAADHADALARIEELEAEVATLREQPIVDVEALAGALIVPLRRELTTKSGPRPKAAA